ncbi:MAG: chorismate mutase [Yoonia sp.]
MSILKKPQDCHDMADLRAQIDLMDAALIDMLAQRATYIDRAVEIKSSNDLPARITSRVDEVIANVRDHATAEGLDPDLAEQLWSQLIEWSIQREAKHIRED